MRPNFVGQLKELRNELIQGAPSKKLMGHNVSGKMLVGLAKSFCEAINKGAAPVIKNSWALMCEIKDRDLADDCLKEFADITSTWGESAIPVSSMQTALDDLVAETMKQFKKGRASDSDDDEPTKRLKESLQQRSASIVSSVRGNITRVLETSIREVDSSVRSINSDEITWNLVRERICNAESDLTDRVGQGSEEAITLLRSTMFPFVLEWAGLALTANEQRSEKARERGEEMCTKLSAALEERDEERARADELSRRVSGADEEIERIKHVHSVQLADIEKDSDKQLKEMEKTSQEALSEKDELVRTWIVKCQTANESSDQGMQKILELENENQILEKRAKTAEEAAEEAQNVKIDLEEIRKVEMLTQQNQTLSDTINELQTTVDSSQNEIEQLQLDNEKSISDLQAHAKRSLEEQSESFSKTRKGLEGRLRDVETRLANEEKSASDLVEKAKQTEADNMQAMKRQKEQHAHTTEMLEVEREHRKGLMDQLESMREEHKQALNTSAVQQRAMVMEHQTEINKLYEKIMLMEADSQEAIRTREGDLKQCQERIRHNKRQHDEFTNELQELKKAKLEHDQVQKNLAKVIAENDHLKTDKSERTQRLNEYKTKASELEKEKASLERKLLMSEFRKNV